MTMRSKHGPLLVSRLRLAVLGLAAAINFVGIAGAEDSAAEISSATSVSEQHIAKCVEALGGADAWHSIETLELTGQLTSFSTTQPFTLLRKRPDFYRFDFFESTYRMTMAWDGSTAWWRTDFPGISKAVWPVEMPRLYQQPMAVEAELEPPFVDADAKGHRIEWIGATRFEGESFQELRLRRRQNPDLVERWFLDPETLLPALRLTQAPFHGYMSEQLSHFLDYREVAGVLMPHRVEIEIGNDFRILEIEQMKINQGIAAERFERPRPVGMEWLQSLAGRWRVDIQSLDDPAFNPERPTSWKSFQSTAVIRAHLSGSLLEEDILVAGDNPRQARRSLTWDRFRQVYRLAHFDNFSRHLDILEGKLVDDRLVMSNLDTDTPIVIYGRPTHVRETLFDIEPDSFRIDRELSADGGRTWVISVRLHYSRQSEQQADAGRRQ